MDPDEWTELDRLTARLSELHSRQALAAQALAAKETLSNADMGDRLALAAQCYLARPVLDDVERVLDPGPHLRQRALHRLGPIPQSFGQRLDDAALDRDVPGDIAVLKFGPLVRPGIAGISEDRLLLVVQQGR